MINQLKQKLDRFFSGPTLTEIVEHKLRHAEAQERMAEHVVKTHSFQAYMARAKINALKAWDDQQLKEKGGQTQAR